MYVIDGKAECYIEGQGHVNDGKAECCIEGEGDVNDGKAQCSLGEKSINAGRPCKASSLINDGKLFRVRVV